MKSKKNMVLSLAVASMMVMGQPSQAVSFEEAGKALDKGVEATVQAGKELKQDITRFLDVASHWGKEYIENLIERHAITGYPDGTFKPDATITKAEFTKILVTALGHDDIENSTDGHWALGYVDKAEKLDIIENNELGNIDEPINRGQMARMIVNASGEELLGKEEYEKVAGRIADIDDIYWKYKLHVAKAFNDNIITGYDDKTFRYDNTATRAEASTMIVKLIDKDKRVKPEYKEVSQASKWYKDITEFEKQPITDFFDPTETPTVVYKVGSLINSYAPSKYAYKIKPSDLPVKIDDFILYDIKPEIEIVGTGKHPTIVLEQSVPNEINVGLYMHISDKDFNVLRSRNNYDDWSKVLRKNPMGNDVLKTYYGILSKRDESKVGKAWKTYDGGDAYYLILNSRESDFVVVVENPFNK